MDTTIIIPCVRRSRFLEKTTLPAIAAHTPSSVPVVIAHEPALNVSECRQKWMDLAETRYVYFMDVDSVIEQDEWLEILLDIMNEHQAGAVTAAEHWNGKDFRGEPFKAQGIISDGNRTAGAGCLYDTKVGAKWDPFLGETYGYIGRELEDVDFGWSICNRGYKCYSTDKVAFNHAWHEQSDCDSDEFALWKVVGALIKLKWALPADQERDQFFRLLHPVATAIYEKNHSLPGGLILQKAIRNIYGDIIEYWGGTLGDTSYLEGCFPPGHHGPFLTTPEQRGVEDIWSGRYKEVKPRSPK